MQNKPSSKKTIIVIAVIVIVALLAYFYWSGGSSSGDALLEAQPNPEANAASARVFALLNQIRSLNIDPSLFNQPAYQTLQDYSVSIPEQGVGRPNPFAPVR